MTSSILGVYASNSFGSARAFNPSYKGYEGNKIGGFGGFIRDILVEYGLLGDAHSRRHESSTLNQTGIKIYIDTTLIDPFFHTCMPFNSVQEIGRQKNVSCAWQREGKKATYVCCGVCTIMSHRETYRHTSRHSYCRVVSKNDFRVIWKTALIIR